MVSKYLDILFNFITHNSVLVCKKEVMNTKKSGITIKKDKIQEEVRRKTAEIEVTKATNGF